MKKRQTKKKPEIKAIIFDIGGVQYFFDHNKAAKPLAKLLRILPKKIFEILSESGQKQGFTTFCEKGATEKQYWNYFLKKIGRQNQTKNYKEFQKIWNKIFSPNKKILALLPKLDKNYKLGLISNVGKGHKKFLIKKHNISKPFSANIFSCDIGIRKPNSKIYKLALKELSSKPKETIFVDDNLRNIRAAKKLGINRRTVSSRLKRAYAKLLAHQKKLRDEQLRKFRREIEED